MRMIAIAPLGLCLLGCGIEPEDKPSRSQLAAVCGVQVDELAKAQSKLKAEVGTDVLKIGSCSLVKEYGGKIKIVSIAKPPAAREWSQMTLMEKQETVRTISKKCGWPIDRFKITETGDLRLLPKSDDHYQTVDCALRELQPTRAPMGFVGNEAPTETR